MANESANGFVGLVLVSHSEAIADGLAELIAEVAGPDVPIVTAGGGPAGSLGTDGAKVHAALRAAAAGSGAVVLMDLGSSVLSVRAVSAADYAAAARLAELRDEDGEVVGSGSGVGA